MPFEDFTKRKWKIKLSDIPELCKKDDELVIKGDSKNVKVECAGKPFLGPGTYHDGNPETIVETEKKEYTITLVVGKPYTLEAKVKTPLIGGSWTAEDNTPPGPGDGGA